ncbi:Glycosyl transferase, family 4, conserved region [Halothece sp. PCC 7418]|uniref:glycosyltransferase family 4 protein n=1 Tax=Halothece sp. (strain PCC 7418) TaxID=65093 RepID=UPI0002A07582|nr:MraY family glycosyltransferase [Halothece sp. PCC 7418]AFZ43715.1 Glycosyl transferase, family 4, conserved region [Halothece sp. PCC 7418]
MSAESYYLLSFLLGTILVIMLTPIVKRVGIATGQVDKPDSRKIHNAPIVRIGGISIFSATVLTVVALYLTKGWDLLSPQEIKNVIGVTLGGCVFFLMGLADDIFDLSPFKRLGLQFLAIGGLWWQGLRIDLSFIPWDNALVVNSLSFLITFLWLAGVANALNWIDGMDGLASGVTGIIALGILFVTLENGNNGMALLMAIMAGSAIAFLWYNFHPATIFMGDGGSNFLGFMLAGASLVGIANESGWGNTLAPFVFLAVPIGDMIIVINARLRKGMSPFVADNIHVHHRLLAKGLSQTMTALLIYSVTLWTGTIGLMFGGIEQPWLYFLPATILLLIMIWQLQRSRKVQKEE